MIRPDQPIELEQEECQVCLFSRRAEVDARIRAGEHPIHIANAFGLDVEEVHHHRIRGHKPPAAPDLAAEPQQDDLFSEMTELLKGWRAS